jgi:hypothetical protein
MTLRISLWAVVGLLAVALAGCGGKSDEEKAKEAAAETSAPVCGTTTEVDGSKLPSDFPKPDGVTYRQQSTAGPSQVVDGTYAGRLDDAYDAYETSLDGGGYKVLFKEKEEEDAEISYEGGGSTGQVALRAVCGEDDKLVVHITSRPK